MITTALTYVHVARPEAAEEFNGAARKFVETYKQFPPEQEHYLVVICCNGQATDEILSIYDGLNCVFMFYDGAGRDIGAQQYAAKSSSADFVVSANSRSSFHRPGWLKLFVKVREKYGEGVYAAMASCEGCPLGQVWPNPHLRTAFYGMDAKLWREFPHTVNSREDSFRFESGEWNIANWCEAQGKQARLVTWDGCWTREDWRKPLHVFRSGNQTNCPVWDRHVEIFNSLPPYEQSLLHNLANGTP